VFTNVAGVPAAPPTHGLVASAVRPDISRWEQGLAWVPERCATAYRLVPTCDVPAAGYEPPRPTAAYYQPMALQVADECSTMGGPVDEERVRRVAEAQFPFAVARELWEGDLSAADTFTVGGDTLSNAFLASADADVIGGSAGSPAIGFGRLEQSALEAAHGQPVMIHVPVRLLPQLASLGVFRHVGTTLITAAGNTLVADGGYTGTGPTGQAAGATVWAYATPPVAVLASAWVIDLDDRNNVDRSINTRTVWATRVFAATFDPCVHLATEITL
jgi:hypothetical protein